MITNMTEKIRFVRLINLTLGLTLLLGLFSMPSMQAGSMTMMDKTGAFYGNAPAGHGHNPPTLCCSDGIGSLIMACGVIVPHFSFVTQFVGAQRVISLPLSVRIAYRETATPPPKI